VICPLFVGASAGSRDTRILLKTLAEALIEALPRQSNQVTTECRNYQFLPCSPAGVLKFNRISDEQDDTVAADLSLGGVRGFCQRRIMC